jgi:ATP-dependent DNA ligase
MAGIVPLVDLPVKPPLEPMLAKLMNEVPEEGELLFEPKWDGFRAIVFRDGDEVFIQSRDKKELNRYFPELIEPLKASLPARCVVDGEIILMQDGKLEFDVLQQRIHPAESRVKKLAAETPAQYVAFDLLCLDDESLIETPQAERRERLEKALADAEPPVMLTPMTRDTDVAKRWFVEFEGAGLDGIVAKPAALPYMPKKRRLLKIKHVRTADCVVAGFRWHKKGPGTLVGSLLLGLYDDEGVLHHVGVTSSFKMKERESLAKELEPLRENAKEGHPWAEWADWESREESDQRMPGSKSRWSAGKNLSWNPLRIERVCEVKYDFMQGDRFRHATTFKRWRTDKEPADCRYDQLEEPAPYDLREVMPRS